ncbi:uncharacterized protein TM35_000291420 [Trypanosoma theileri]|uniref:Uncharacterized protein n=1 Tax=Trypanosoma theileri TaxID=67003 RepID=A0A1X0NQ49_9TRYP|nr:uncharacterized protein TM35_000291420 [Trypanosoma theileri]ORC86260.1 hypothetical protein TM35_000291420 [Trypanosoma theileri]
MLHRTFCICAAATAFHHNNNHNHNNNNNNNSNNRAESRSISERALRIRRQELFYRQLRRLIIPGFLAYGLFVLRPHEGHFVRYLAERRHHEAAFNRLFPPTPTPTTVEGNSKEEKGKQKREEGGYLSSWWRGNKSNNHNNSNSNKNEEETDEARLARKRLLFARERLYSAEEGTEMFRPIDAAQRATDLASQQEHPPMHVLSEELLQLMQESKAYEANKGINTDDNNTALSTVSTSSCMPVRLEFHDWYLFATGAVVFSDRSGTTVKRLRFIGFCGMIWKEL